MTQFSPEELIEIRGLFKESLQTINLEQNIDISADQIGLTINQDEIRLLFEIAVESFTDGINYIDNIFISEQKKVESSSITKALQTFEDTIQRKLFTLKKAPAPALASSVQSSIVEDSSQKKNPYFFVPISWGYGLLSFILDLAIVFCLAAFSAYLALPTIPDVWTSLTGIEQYLYYLPVTFGLLPLVSIFYLVVFALYESPTIGLTLLGCDIVGNRGDKLDRLTLVNRASIAPVSYLLLGVLSPLLGQPRMHDLLMGTKIVRKIPKATYKRGKS